MSDSYDIYTLFLVDNENGRLVEVADLRFLVTRLENPVEKFFLNEEIMRVINFWTERDWSGPVFIPRGHYGILLPNLAFRLQLIRCEGGRRIYMTVFDRSLSLRM